ncbi:hypothetical protein [Streptomyces sp. NPDC093223]|uniref:hypothetical protein n=1 Tax=Streptomyces sp. NPDC093223 TaxID=3366033 RepID=UPI00381F4EC7
MNLRDAKEQVERDQPHLTGTAKVQAIKALRDQARASGTWKAKSDRKPEPAPKPEPVEKVTSVGAAWLGLLVVIVVTQVVGYLAWGSPLDEPHWYDVLHLFLLIAAVVGVVDAHRKRNRRS